MVVEKDKEIGFIRDQTLDHNDKLDFASQKRILRQKLELRTAQLKEEELLLQKLRRDWDMDKRLAAWRRSSARNYD